MSTARSYSCPSCSGVWASLDSATGRPAEGLLSATVIARSATVADGLSTTLFVLGATRGAALLARYPGTEAYFLLPAADTSWTTVHLGGG